MILTNKYGLPESFFQAVLNDKYSRGGADYSVTELINPPRITLLKRRHADEITEDVSDLIWSLLGRSVHALLDAAQVPNALTEERIKITMHGYEISGQSDHYKNKVVSDYKATSVYSRLYESRFDEWEKQINSYAFLFREIGFEVDHVEIIAIYRDWSKRQSEQEENYPIAPVEKIPLGLWSMDAQRKYLSRRVLLYQESESLSDSDLPICSVDDRWEKPTIYAVMKKKQKRAVRNGLHEDLQTAQAQVDSGENLHIEMRPGSRVRCEAYCNVAPFCDEFKQYKNQ